MTTIVTKAMLEAAHKAEVEHYARNHSQGTMFFTTPYPCTEIYHRGGAKGPISK